MLMAVLSSVLYACISLLFVFFLSHKDVFYVKDRKADVMFAVGLLLLFLVKFYMAYVLPGHVQDTGLFRAWAAFGEHHSLSEFYKTELYVDYPPVYLYVLFFLGKLLSGLGVSSDGALYMAFVKCVPMLFDALSCLFFYGFCKKRMGAFSALVFTGFLAFSPAAILNSAVWGQIDSVTTLLSLLMLLALSEKRYPASSALFCVLVLTKPQMVLFAPVLGFVMLFDFVFSEDKINCLKHFLKALLLSLLVLVLVPLPITGGDFGLLFKNYQDAFGLYPYATLNAANLFGLFGANWTRVDEIFWLFSYKTWGYIFIVLSSLLVGVLAFLKRDRASILWLGAFLVLSVFTLGHTMHERYSYPALLFLLFLCAESKSASLLWLYIGFTLVSFFNCAYVLVLNLENSFIYGNDVLFRVLSGVGVLLFVIFVCLMLQNFVKKGAGYEKHSVKK